MHIKVTPKTRRNIGRILPFGLIWLTTSLVFLFNDLSLTGGKSPDASAYIELTLPVIIFAQASITLMGLFVGLMETVVFEKRFNRYSLGKKILYKLGTYLFVIFLVMSITYPIAASMENKLPLTDIAVWQQTGTFFSSFTFLNTFIQLAFLLLLSLLYSAISENIGYQVLRNFFTGQYHTPKVERRIFMFLDMNDSTTIAEELGHVQYFKLLERYYDCMSEPIINQLGEVYQYIGDEVVVSWPAQQGFMDNNCINCFFAIKQQLIEEKEKFLQDFGLAPGFKAGMHVGEVTTGEIGALKREIIFTGDVINSTARIQGLCKANQAELIISDDLFKELQHPGQLSVESLGAHALKGKLTAIPLHKVIV